MGAPLSNLLHTHTLQNQKTDNDKLSDDICIDDAHVH